LLTADEATDVATALLKTRNHEYEDLKRLHEYSEGEAVGVYMPRDAREEYRWIASQARVNLIPKIIEEHTSSLSVEGYKSPDASENLPAWEDHWQVNRMDARQIGVHRAALEYPASYVTILPGDTAPAWTPYSPRDLTAVYDDAVNDEWPQYALHVRKTGETLALRLIAPNEVIRFTAKNADATPVYVGTERHNVPWCPVVRFASEFNLDDSADGLVSRLIEMQNQVNLTTLNGLVAQVFAAFPQKWVTGMDVPIDESGRPVEPFKAAVNRLWMGEGEATRFGQFEAADLKQYLDFREDTIRLACTIANVPPHTVLGALTNLGAEAMAAAEMSKTRYENVLRLLFGESWEQCFRLSRYVAGDKAAMDDTAAEVVWGDTSARSWSQDVDAATKLRSIGLPMSYIAEKLGESPQQIPQLLEDIEAEQTVVAVNQARAFGVTGLTADEAVA